MKRLTCLLLASLLLLSGCSSSNKTPSETSTPEVNAVSGTFKATTTGRKGPMTVETVLEKGEIKSVTVLEHTESKIYSDKALETIPQEIVANQSTNIDAVAGATFTSNAIKFAVEDCLKQAGADKTNYSAEVKKVTPTDEVVEADIVIMGAGAAGLMAGINAAEAGKKVVIAETLGFAGGNLLSAVGVIAGPGSKIQKAHGIEMTPDSYLDTKIKRRDAAKTYLQYHDETPERTLRFYQQNQIVCDWITDRGIKYVEPPMGVSHTLAPGYYQGVSNFTYFLIDTFEKAGGKIYYETTGTSLIKEGDAVVGFTAVSDEKNYTFKGESTLVVTGGFTSNSEKVKELYPEFSSMYSTAMISNTGDGLDMIEAVGGTTEAIDAGIHKIPVTTKGKIDIPFFTIMSGAILVNENGERFTSEAGNPPAMMELMIKEHNGKGYFILDEDDKNLLTPTTSSIFNLEAAEVFSNVEEAAKAMNMPGLVEQVKSYNEGASAEKPVDEQFKRAFNVSPIEGDKIYVLPIEPGLYLTYGGVKTDDDMRVLDTEGNHIKGLYAAGDITGSTEVKEGFGYTAGVTHALSFGMIASETIMNDTK